MNAAEHESDPAADAVTVFHRAVARLFTVHDVATRPEVLQALESGRLARFATYAEWLFDLPLTTDESQRIRSLYDHCLISERPRRHDGRRPASKQEATADHDAVVDRRARDRAPTRTDHVPRPSLVIQAYTEESLYVRVKQPLDVDVHKASTALDSGTALEPMLDTELQATNAAEFADLLGLIQLRSGLTPPRIARASGIARSQVYSMLRRGTLPTRQDQVVQFLRVCGLPHHQIMRIVRLWLELRGHARQPSPKADSPADRTLAELTRVLSDMIDKACAGESADLGLVITEPSDAA
ncbi:hypothetical protein GCM10022243_57210 [Saccharothrix violaceirubra]|uniref:DNA-binding phage protein n=1 Tax=Saccharothrix violaceirubra TaxID=413306 RepID=A0A7W7T3W4_9PSEU|nr:hypothetical protein [Saccharothrix violaceirubra]MBB4965846.1 DNA-binding phage protein [Saccharothrix violaceirubra]